MEKTNKEVTVKEADEQAEKMGVELCVQGILVEALKLYRQQTHSVQQMLAYVRQLDKSGDLEGLEEEINGEISQVDSSGDDDSSDDDERVEKFNEAHLKMYEMATEDELEMLKSGKMDDAIAELQKHKDHKDVTKEMLIEACEKKLEIAKELADAANKTKETDKNKNNNNNKKKK